jgi:plastocyanin
VIRRVAAFLLVVFVGAACSNGSKVGSGVDTTKHTGGNLSLGQDTTTSQATRFTIPVPTAPPTTHVRVTTAPTTPPTAPTTAAPGTYQVITINSDNASFTQFSPARVSVYVGTPVHWQNHDTKPRSVVDSNGAFRSPLIPSGGEWVYSPAAAGDFNYVDGTRPYAVGELLVLAR